MNIQKHFTLSLILFILTLSSFAQQVNEPKDLSPQWSQAYKPFKIVGNLYYVGTYDLSCYLITTPEGNILINTGLAASASTIQDAIETLGFKLADTKILLTTQAHYDHTGALAEIKQQTGAKMLANAADVAALEDGGTSDYELGKYGVTFKPVKVDRQLHDGDTISLGGMNLIMLHHPGHTKGSCSYLFDVQDGNKTYRVAIVNLPSIITDRKFTDIPAYPAIAKDYAYTFESLKKLEFDLWLSSHASQFNLHSKRKEGDAYKPAVFADRGGYDKAVRELEEVYLKKIKTDN